MRRLLVVVCIAGCSGPRAAPPPPAPEPVEFVSSQGKGRGLLVVPAGRGPFPGIVLIHGDFGLDEQMRRNAERLAGKGYVVLAVDLFRGEKPDNILDAHITDRGLPEERIRADLKASVDLLREHKDVRHDAIGVIGWDMGGGHALDAALADPRLVAVVTCYGRLTTDPELLRKMKASVLGIFGDKDEGIPPETIQAFRQAMMKAGKKVAGLHVFEGCDNGFMNPPANAKTGPTEASATARAWKLIDEYLARELLRRTQP
jgi:carboxymethylenebutenolidase